VTISDRRKALQDIRDLLTDAAKDALPRELPALARELRLVWAELEALPAAGGSKAVPDQIARRREERRRKAAGG
jgi:hypothetical protein